MRKLLILFLAPSIASAEVLLRAEFSDYMDSLKNMNHYLGFENKEPACSAADEANARLKSYLLRFQQEWPDVNWDEHQAGVENVVDYCNKIGF